MNVDIGRGVVTADFLAGEKACKNTFGVFAHEPSFERTVAGKDETATRICGAHGLKGAENKFVVFLGGHATDVEHYRRVVLRTPAGAKFARATGGIELAGVDPAREDGKITETVRGEFGTQLGGGGKGALRTVVHVAEPSEREAVKRAIAVGSRVRVEIGVKTRAHRQAKGTCGGDGGSAEWTLRGDVHQIGWVFAPKFAQRATGG